MQTTPRQRFILISLCLSATLLIGCADGPLYRLWYRKQWAADEQYGPTFHTRLQEVETLREEVEDLPHEEQGRVAERLTRNLAQEATPLYRAAVVRTLGRMKVPAATEGLRMAVNDSDPSVRIAACEAWARRGDGEGLAVLSHLVGSDTNLDVRMAATRELAEFDSPSAVRALGLALNDPDPALQHRAVQSLKSVTGEDLGNNIPAWRQYVQNGTVDPNQRETPSIVQRMRDLF
jgi:hypothetical protein